MKNLEGIEKFESNVHGHGFRKISSNPAKDVCDKKQKYMFMKFIKGLIIAFL